MQDPQNHPDMHAYLEPVIVPPGHSYLWRLDDYPWSRNVWNYHPEFELHLIRHSTGLVYVGDYIGQFEAGQLILVGANLPHNWVTPGIGNRLLAGRDIVIQFDAQKFTSSDGAFSELSNTDKLFSDAHRGVEFLGATAQAGRQIIESMDGKGKLSNLSKMLELLDLLSSSTETRLLASAAFVASNRIKGQKEHVVIEKALMYLQDNFLENPSLADVADQVGLSESAFSRFFKHKTGNTFSEHMVSLRLWMASKLLIETDQPVTDICFEAGFGNISNFNRVFLRKLGMTPSKYRSASGLRNHSITQEQKWNAKR